MMRNKTVVITSILAVLLVLWVGLGGLRMGTDQEDAITDSPTPSPVGTPVGIGTLVEIGTLVGIGTLAGEPVLIDEAAVTRGVENLRKFYESQSGKGLFEDSPVPDEEASRVAIVKGELVLFAKKQLIAKYGLTITPGEDHKAFSAVMQALSGETGQSVADHLRNISNGLRAMHISGATFETAFDIYCKPFGIEEKEFRFYADSLKQHSDDPESFIASIPTAEGQLKQQALADEGLSGVIIERKLAEKLLNRSIEETDFHSYLADLDYEVLSYLRDNLQIADLRYRNVLRRIEQDMKIMRGEFEENPS